MILTGFTDEVSPDFSRQVDACRVLSWDWIDLRTVGDKNICHLETGEMENLLEVLRDSGIRIASFGSPVANWSRSLDYPLKDEIRELEHAAGLMRMADVKGIRIMSYQTDAPIPLHDPVRDKVLNRLKELSRVAGNEGIVLLHENCETWGGQSLEHTLFLLDNIHLPAFRLIFDTGNPPGSPDIRGTVPFKRQNSLEFLKAVYEAVDMVHIKDARFSKEDGTVYTWPGEGDAGLSGIFSWLKKQEYSGPFSIEPHLAVVYHDESVKSDEKKRWDMFIEYARRSSRLLKAAGFT